MQYLGPASDDLAQVEGLNRAFLDHLAAEGRPLAASLAPAVAAALQQASSAARERLAGSPFLLFSLGERDERTWSGLFRGAVAPDLVDCLERPTAAEARIACAALVFLWQFASRNPYAMRVVSGAPRDWCEKLAASRPLDLIEFASTRKGLLRLRFADNSHFWRRLGFAGTSEEAEIRRAAHITALQTVLTRAGYEAQARLPAAACSMPSPAREVADRGAVSQSRERRYNTPPHEGADNKTTRKDLRKR